MRLETPELLILLALAPLVGLLMGRRGGQANVRFSSLETMGGVRRSWRVRLRGMLVVLRMLCIVLLVWALARPREGSEQHKVTTKGVVMQLVVDRSGSMGEAMSYKGQRLSRLEVVKRVLAEFIQGEQGMAGRGGDLLGLITFAGYAETNCPVVHAHDAILGFLKETQLVTLRSEDGTAIGDALALAAARLQTTAEEISRRNAKLLAGVEASDQEDVKPTFNIQSKAIILLTDGMNNRGRHDPLEAAALAEKWGIKIYTIGIGGGETFRQTDSLFGFFQPAGSGLDEGLLKEIARRTGGIYGRADDENTLRKLFEKIDELEKSQVESVQYSLYKEQFGRWVLAALMLLGLEILLGCTVFRKVP